MSYLKFICSRCGNKTLEAVVDNATVVSAIVAIDEDGNVEYGTPIITDGNFQFFQCTNCGHVYQDEFGDVLENEQELAEWLLEQDYNTPTQEKYIDDKE